MKCGKFNTHIDMQDKFFLCYPLECKCTINDLYYIRFVLRGNGRIHLEAFIEFPEYSITPARNISLSSTSRNKILFAGCWILESTR